MELRLKRIARKDDYTIGRLYINGKYVCDTLEDYDRLYFGGIKVAGKTAIPRGTYRVTFTYSPKFGKKKPYSTLSNGVLPLLTDVPMYSGVRIHVGNTASDTEGCILVGENKVVGQVVNSTATYTRLWKSYFNPARRCKEGVHITIE